MNTENNFQFEQRFAAANRSAVNNKLKNVAKDIRYTFSFRNPTWHISVTRIFPLIMLSICTMFLMFQTIVKNAELKAIKESAAYKISLLQSNPHPEIPRYLQDPVK